MQEKLYGHEYKETDGYKRELFEFEAKIKKKVQ